MPETLSKSKYTKAKLRRIIGYLFLASGILGLVSPGTFMWWWNYIPLFFFGHAGYYLFFPLLSLLGLYMMFKDVIKIKLFCIREVIGLFLILLMVCAILTHVRHGGNENFSDQYLGYFLDTFSQACGNYGSAIRGNIRGINLGGGLSGLLLSSLLNLPNSEFTYYFFIVLIGLVALVLILYPLIKEIFYTISAHIVKNRSKRNRESENGKKPLNIDSYSFVESEKSSSKEDAPLAISYKEVDYEEVETEQGELEIKVEKNKETPLPSRKEVHESLDHDSAIPEYATPIEENISEAFPSPDFSPMKPAVFVLGGSSQTESKQTPIEEKKETPIYPQNVEEVEEKEEEVETSFTPSYLEETPIEEEKSIDAAEETSIEEDIPYGTPVERDYSFFKKEEPAEAKVEEVNEPKLEPEPIYVAPKVEKEAEPIKETPIVTPKVEVKEEDTSPVKEENKEDTSGLIYFGPIGVAKATPRPKYVYPDASLLQEYPEDKNAIQNEKDALERTELLNQSLKDLGVGAHVDSFTIGPGVTRYNIKTDPNVKVNAIKNVVDDLSIRLKGVVARFSAVVGGQDYSGLEVPNLVKSLVSYKEVFTALPSDISTPKNSMLIPFGKSVEGKIVYGNLTEFPHMLVCGTTGSGKSVFLHSVLTTLIMRNRPEDLKLVLIDPKRVEMNKYNEIPHLLCPPVKDSDEAKVAIDKLAEEMDRRYTIFEHAYVSDIKEFNNDVAPVKGCQKLPYIVCVVEEYADLVDKNKTVSEPLNRLAQKARACGIHLIIATQRPDAKVIDGRLKSNISTIVALHVPKVVDSMVVLGEGGAEKLSDHGDMLVSCSQVSRDSFARLQGCFVNSNEIRAVMEMARSQQKVKYDPYFLDLRSNIRDVNDASQPIANVAELKAAEGEAKYQLIKSAIMKREYTSISQIQRDYEVGFPRAGKIFRRLQNEGIVEINTDTHNNSRGSRVLVHEEEEISENPGSISTSKIVG